MSDLINPEHYKTGEKETIDVIKSSLTPEEYVGYLKGNIIKYKERAGKKVYVNNCHKQSYVADIKKSDWYNQRLKETFIRG